MVQHSWMMTQVQPEHSGTGVTGRLVVAIAWLYTTYLTK